MPAGSAPPSTIEPGGMIPGTRYRALRPLGRGSGGAIYEVEHLELGRRFVLEVLRADFARRRDLVRRARADWQALGKLKHPNIARVTDAGVTQHGLPYFVMEQLSGETLRQRLTRRRSVTVPEALAIAKDVSMALAAAHSIGVVHQNLRPETVFLAAHGRAKLLEFGIARVDEDTGVQPPSTEASAAPRYRAPEQMLGLALDSRSDLYGVGLVLFEMVAGRAVFRAPVFDRSPRARSLAEVVPGVARELSELVARLLAPEPDARPRLADDVVQELRRLEQRYEHQVSTTQATAHYTTARLPFLVDTASVVSELDVIVPLPSQTLEGIPWTVHDEVEAPAQESRASTHPSVGFRTRPPPMLALVALEGRASTDVEAPGRSSAPAATAEPSLPRSARAPRMGMRLMLVMSCALLGGVLVASLARRGIAGEADASEPQSLGLSGAVQHGVGRSKAQPPTRPAGANRAGGAWTCPGAGAAD